jgi:predicted Zn-dependent protease
MNDPMIPISIGSSYCSVENIKEAEGYFDIAIQNTPSDPKIYLTIGVALLENEVPRLAQKYLKQGIKAISNVPEIHILLAQAYLLDDKISNARQELNKALRFAQEQNNQALVEIIEQMLVAIRFSDFFGGLFIDNEDDEIW